MKMKLLPGIIALILISYAYESSAEVLLQGTSTVDKGFKVEGPGTDLSCAKFTVTLTGGPNSNIMAGVLTSASVTTISANYGSYVTTQDVVDGVKPRLITGSECTFTEFGSSATCSKTVTLMPSESYYIGILNSDDPTVAFSYKIESCAASSSGTPSSSGFHLNTGDTIHYETGTCPFTSSCAETCTKNNIYSITKNPGQLVFTPKSASLSGCSCTTETYDGTSSGNTFTGTGFTITTTSSTAVLSIPSSSCSSTWHIDTASSSGITLNGLLGLISASVVAFVLV